MASSINAIDDIVREYLLYKGYVNTIKTLEQERKDDKEKGLRVNRIVDYILVCVNKSEFSALQVFWNHLSKKFFSRLNHDLMNTAHKLESTLLRLFLINAHRNGRHEEVKLFFERMSSVLQDRRDWKEWFALPYIRNPDQHPSFKIYYSKDWYDAFIVSLYNFFSIMLAGLPLPTLLQFETEHQRLQTLVTEKNLLHNQLATTKNELVEAEATVQNLEKRVQMLEARLAHNVAIMSADKPSSKKAPVKSNQKKLKVSEGKAKSPAAYSSPEELTLTPAATRQEEYKATGGRSDGIIVVEEKVYKEHTVPIAQCHFSPNGVHIASIDIENGLKIWEPNLMTKSSSKFKIDVLSMDWVHQGGSDNLLMLGFNKGQVKLYDVVSSLPLWEFAIDRNYPRILSVACSSSSGVFAVSGAGWHTPVIGGAVTNRATSSLTSPSLPSQLTKSSEMKIISQRNSEQLFDPTPGELSIWDINQQKIQSVLPLNPAIAVNCMSFNHNSNLLVTGGVDGMIRLFDVVQGECLCGWTAHHGEILNVQFSSDETSVYSLGEDNQFCQWSTLRTTEKMAQYSIHSNASSPTSGWDKGYFPSNPLGKLFAFGSDDKYVLTCAPSNSILYEISDGTLKHVIDLCGHTGPVTCVDWVPGRRSFSTCITGSTDNTVRVVNLLKT